MDKISAYDKSSRKDSIYDKIHEELCKYYEIKFNDISLDFELIDLTTDKKLDLNESSILIHLHREKINVSPQSLKTYLRSHFIKKYNPIKQYLETLPSWDGKDYIKQYASYVPTDDDDFFYLQLRKWAVRAIKSIYHDDQINKHALILANGPQNVGKSTYLKFLCPQVLLNFYAENIGITKDDRIKICKVFVLNIEELDILGKYDINSIKAIISQVTVNERLPYADKSSLLFRIASFVGSTNKLEFLNDDSGNVRWIVFDVMGKINFNYSTEFDINNFWAQAYHIYQFQKDFKSDLSADEMTINEKRNEKYFIQSTESEYILRFYETSEDIDFFRTATDISTELAVMGNKLNIQKIGTCLKKYGFIRLKHPQKQVYGYMAKPKFKDTPWGFNN